MPANTYGRQVVIVLTNKSGGSVATGDIVVFDTTTDESFTTTTAARVELSVGIAQETIANNALGRVLVAGYAALVNVPASVTRGHYIESHTVVKQATGSATRRSGSLGQFAKTSATPSAWLWGQTDQTAAGGGSGALVLLEQYTASASAQLDFTTFISSTYDDYLLELVNVLPATDAVDLRIRVGTGGGPTYDTGANYAWTHLYGYNATSGVEGAAGAAFISIRGSVSNTVHGLSGSVRLYNPGATALNKVLTYQTMAYVGAVTAFVMDTGGGAYKSNTAVTALRFYFSAGNITSGTIRAYGIAK